MKVALSVIAACLFLLVVATAKADQTEKLASGKTIDIISAGPLQSPQGWSAFVLKYRTTTSFSDIQALRGEADEVWNRLAANMEKTQYDRAVLMATGPAQGGLITHSSGYNFSFQKVNGNWRVLDIVAATPAKLDDKTARDTLARFDTAIENREFNAGLLYLGDKWTQTTAYVGKSPVPDTTIDRIQFVAMTANALARTQDFKHTRKIEKINIAPDGQSGSIESDEEESGVIDGKPVKLLDHSIDDLAIVGQSIVFTKSASTTAVQ